MMTPEDVVALASDERDLIDVRYWPDLRDGPWITCTFWSDIEGRLECTGLLIRHRWRSEPLSSVALRSVRIGDLQRHVRGELLAKTKRPTPGHSPQMASDLEELIETRKRRYDHEHWHRVVEVYTTAEQNGDPPTRTVAETMGVSHSTAAKWVARCRNNYGLLPPTTRGRARGVRLKMIDPVGVE